MTTFSTPTPIDVAIDLQVGAVDIVASDRADTVVTLTGTNPDREADRRGAEETKVDFDGRRLTITGPRPRISWFGPSESIDVRVELPTGSRLTADIAVGGLKSVGRLGNTRIKSSIGLVDVESAGDLWLKSSHGNSTVGTAEGAIEINASHGQVRVGTVTGDAVIKSSHGSIEIGESGGDVEAKLSFGDLDIATARASVAAKTAHGSIHVREVSAGSIDVESGLGGISIGVRPQVPAWLDLASKHGHVRNQLAADSAPQTGEQTVAVRARTQVGDITIERSRS